MKILGKILYWIFVIFVIFVIYQLIKNILGGSWGMDEFLATLVITNLGYTFYLSAKLSEHIGWHKGKENPD